jgi:Carboxypeptidase regulatory-like domain
MTIRAACFILFAGLSCHGQSLSGIVQDRTESGIPRTLVFLESETDPSRRFLTRADDRGIYRFSELSAGVYRLWLRAAGFAPIELKAVELASGEEKSMPRVTLQVDGGCPVGPMDVLLTFSDMRLLPLAGQARNLAGRVVEVVDYERTPVADADVSLICEKDRVCTRIRTDSKGEFVFEGVPLGYYGLLIGRSFFYPRFYPRLDRSLDGRQDLELIYELFLEPCPEKYCDPARRPKPVLTGQITICQ